MQVREGAAETGPAIHLGEQAGDAKVRHHPIQPVGQGLRLLRCHRLERRDFQLIAFDSDVFEPVCRGFGRHLGEAPFQQSAALGKILFGGCRRRDGQRSGLAHRGEQGGRNQLVFDGAPLPAALDPDVAGAQPVSQCQQGRRLPGSALATIRALSRQESPDARAMRSSSACCFFLATKFGRKQPRLQSERRIARLAISELA